MFLVYNVVTEDRLTKGARDVLLGTEKGGRDGEEADRKVPQPQPQPGSQGLVDTC